MSVRKGVYEMVSVIGGTFQNLVERVGVAAAQMIVYGDVPRELAMSRARDDVVKLPLGGNATVTSLMKDVGAPEHIDMARRMADVSTDFGLVQTRSVGAAAYKQFRDGPDFERFVEQNIFEPMLIESNGAIDLLEHTVMCSAAGGTGSAVARPWSDDVANFCLERLDDAVVLSQCFLVGGLSHAGNGERIFPNTAQTVREWVEWVQSPDHHNRIVRSVLLTELPMVRAAKDLRDRYAMSLLQAFRAAQTRECMERGSVNVPIHPLGGVQILQAGWWSTIAEEELASYVATVHLEQLRELITIGPNPGMIHKFEIELDGESIDEEPIQKLLAEVKRAGGVRPENLIESCRAHLGIGGGCVWVTLANKTRLDLQGDWKASLSSPARGFDGFRKKLATLRTILGRIDREVAALSRSIEGLEYRVTKAQKGLELAIKAIFPVRRLARLCASFGNPNQRLARFKDCVGRLREQDRELAREQARLETLQGVREGLSGELQSEVDRLNGLRRALKACATFTDGASKPPVECRPISEVLPGLLDSVSLTAPRFAQFVSGVSIRKVTLQGLMRLVGAEKPCEEVIAKALLDTPPVEAPRWGGRNWTGGGESVFIVLPPMNAVTVSRIRAAVQALDDIAEVVSGDTCEAGTAVVRLELRRPVDLRQIETSLLMKSRQKVTEDPATFCIDDLLAPSGNGGLRHVNA